MESSFLILARRHIRRNRKKTFILDHRSSNQIKVFQEYFQRPGTRTLVSQEETNSWHFYFFSPPSFGLEHKLFSKMETPSSQPPNIPQSKFTIQNHCAFNQTFQCLYESICLITCASSLFWCLSNEGIWGNSPSECVCSGCKYPSWDKGYMAIIMFFFSLFFLFFFMIEVAKNLGSSLLWWLCFVCSRTISSFQWGCESLKENSLRWLHELSNSSKGKLLERANWILLC